MINKLPKWILWGGCVLAFNAGCINSTALVGFTHLSASHVTGNVTLFATALAEQHYQQATRLAPGDGRWWLGLGLAFDAEGRSSEAREAFLQARQCGNLGAELMAMVEQKLR